MWTLEVLSWVPSVSREFFSERLTCQYEVRNTGNVTVTNIDVTETAFEGGTPVTITCPGATVPSNRIATMAPGGTVTCSGTYTVTESDVLNDD